MLKSPIIRALLALNGLVLLIWIGVWVRNGLEARSKRETQRGEFRQVLVSHAGMTRMDATAFQAIGEKVHENRRLTDNDLDVVLDNLDREYPGSPLRYSEQNGLPKTLFSISHLIDAKEMTVDQERAIARRLPPFPTPSSLPDMGSREVLKGVFSLVRKLAKNFKDDSARTDLLNAIPQ